MEEEFEITLKLLKEQKNNTKAKLESTISIEEKNKFINMIYDIDDKIYHTNKKFEEVKNYKKD